MGAEVVLPLPSPRSLVPRATQVRGAWLASSVRSLRAAGVFDRYLEVVSDEYRETLRAPAASEWYPIEVMVAHYTAAEALDLPTDEIVEIGRNATAAAHHAVIDVAVKLAVASGATPWTAIQQLGRLWTRTFIGGGIGAVKLGPKEARLEMVQWPCCANRYVRAGVRGVTLGLVETFCQKAYVHEVPELLSPTSLGLRLSWV
jgi:hypothetical protein